MAVAAIATANLSKDYGLGRGLFELDLQVAQQEVFGFLGPNGAGKSTTIRCLMGLIRPTAGSAHIFGLDCLRGSEVVAYLGALRGGANLKVVRNLAERFSLDLSRRYREYSSGNKRKLGIVIAFMHQPQLLILDEPTNGLDPLNQQEFFDLTTEAREDGATIFLSSHILSEVEHLCDRVGIIRSGRLVNIADLDELHRIRFHHVEMEFAPDGKIPVEAIRSAVGVEDVVASDRTVTCTVRGTFEPLLDAIRGANVTNLVSHEPSLEEIFLEYYREAPPPKALPK